jgi:hypothetical protein
VETARGSVVPADAARVFGPVVPTRLQGRGVDGVLVLRVRGVDDEEDVVARGR